MCKDELLKHALTKSLRGGGIHSPPPPSKIGRIKSDEGSAADESSGAADVEDDKATTES